MVAAAVHARVVGRVRNARFNGLVVRGRGVERGSIRILVARQRNGLGIVARGGERRLLFGKAAGFEACEHREAGHIARKGGAGDRGRAEGEFQGEGKFLFLRRHIEGAVLPAVEDVFGLARIVLDVDGGKGGRVDRADRRLRVAVYKRDRRARAALQVRRLDPERDHQRLPLGNGEQGIVRRRRRVRRALAAVQEQELIARAVCKRQGGVIFQSVFQRLRVVGAARNGGNGFKPAVCQIAAYGEGCVGEVTSHGVPAVVFRVRNGRVGGQVERLHFSVQLVQIERKQVACNALRVEGAFVAEGRGVKGDGIAFENARFGQRRIPVFRLEDRVGQVVEEGVALHIVVVVRGVARRLPAQPEVDRKGRRRVRGGADVEGVFHPAVVFGRGVFVRCGIQDLRVDVAHHQRIL